MAEYTVDKVEGDVITTKEGTTFLAGELMFSDRPEAKSILKQVKDIQQQERAFEGTETTEPGLGAPVKVEPGAREYGKPMGGLRYRGAPAVVAQPPSLQPPPPAAPVPPVPEPPPVTIPMQPPVARRPPTAAQMVARRGRQVLMPARAAAKETEQEWFQSLEDVTEAQRKLTDIAVLDAWGKENLINETRQVEQQAAADRRAVEQRKLQAVQRQVQKIDDAEEDFAAMKVEDFWAKQDTGTRIIAALAQALGGVQAARRGGPNIIMQQVNRIVNSDLERQKANIAMGRVKLQHLRGALPRISQMYDTEIEQNAAGELASLRQVRRQLQAMMAVSESDVALQNGNILAAELDNQIKQIKMQMAQAAYANAQQQVSAQVSAARRQATPTGFEDYDAKRYVKAAGGNARDAQAAKDVTKGFAMNDDLRGHIAALKKLVDKHGKEVINRGAVAEAFGLVQQISTSLAVQKGLGAISQDDKIIVEGISGGNPLEATNMAVNNLDGLGRALSRSDLILTKRTNAVKPDQIPELYRGEIIYPAERVWQPRGAVEAAQQSIEPGLKE